jgi:hypothetical protein
VHINENKGTVSKGGQALIDSTTPDSRRCMRQQQELEQFDPERPSPAALAGLHLDQY